MENKTTIENKIQRFSNLDNEVFYNLLKSYDHVNYKIEFLDEKDIFSTIDCQMTATTKNKEVTYDVELKNRSVEKLYQDTIIEVKKVNALNENKNEVKLYVVIYPKINKILIWNINDDLLKKSELTKMYLNKNTVCGNTKIEKDVYKLKIKDAKIIDFNLNKWREKYNGLYLQTNKK